MLYQKSPIAYNNSWVCASKFREDRDPISLIATEQLLNEKVLDGREGADELAGGV